MKTNPDYNLVIKRLHLYYDMKLITFGIDKDKNLIVQFPVFTQPYAQQVLILYQIETVPLPIIDQNTQAYSYTHPQVDRPYIALNSETCITIRHQELRKCKRTGYEFYSKEPFVVKQKSRYSRESAIYFDLDPGNKKQNCKFDFNYNISGIISTVLDGGNEIILANWPNDKHIICSVNNYIPITSTVLDGGHEIILANSPNDKHIICSANNDIPITIPSHPYVLVNRSGLCNSGIQAENHFLWESLSACHDLNSKLVMYFMVNTAFANYLDQFTNFTESLEFPILKNKTAFKLALPISLNMSKFDSDLPAAPRNLKDFINQYNQKKEIFDLNKRHEKSIVLDLTTNKTFFSNNYIIDVFLFVTAVISLLVTNLVIYLLCKYKKLIMLVACLALQHIGEVGTVTTQKRSQNGMQNSDLYKLDINSFWSSDVCSSILQKIKAVQGMHVLSCSEDWDIYYIYTIVWSYKTM